MRIIVYLILLSTIFSCEKKKEKPSKAVKLKKSLIPPLKWKLYESKDKIFSIDSPGNVSHERKKLIKTKKGKIEATIIYFGAPPNVYFVSYTDKPESLKNLKPVLIFEKQIASIIKRLRGKMLTKRYFKIQKYDAVEISIIALDQTKLIRFLLTEDKLFQLGANFITKRPNTKPAQRFLDSFKLLTP
jgi:hypothetical protein